MWSFASERSLRLAVWSAVALCAIAAAGFYHFQNTVKPVGGDISLAKMFWLAYAVFLWGVLPLLLLADGRICLPLRRGFALLAALMLARAVVEGWLLYVSHGWSTWYGIGHDVVCAAVLLWSAGRAPVASALDRLARLHARVSAAFFLPEMYFAWYMQANFDTKGENAIYFVPDDPRYAVVLRATTAAVVCLTLYLPVFLYRWIHVSKHENR